MPARRTGTVDKYERASGRICYRARIRLADGTRARVDIPARYCVAAGGKTAEQRADLYAEAVQEREDEKGELLAARRARLAEAAKAEAAPEPNGSGETVASGANDGSAIERSAASTPSATIKAGSASTSFPRPGASRSSLRCGPYFHASTKSATASRPSCGCPITRIARSCCASTSNWPE
jgi:hypothetical protein